LDAEDEGLECKPELLLYAFELAGPYATGKSNTAKLQNRQELALSLVDWAIMECDRGMRVLELTNRVSDLEAENATLRKGNGGTIYIGPFGI
jgi:hypothetical protein